MVLLDVLPYPDYPKRPIEVIRDTVNNLDTIAAPLQQIGDSNQGSHGSLTAIILALIAALTALGIVIFFVRSHSLKVG